MNTTTNTTKKTRPYNKTGRYSKKNTKNGNTNDSINYAQLTKAINEFVALTTVEQNLVVALARLIN